MNPSPSGVAASPNPFPRGDGVVEVLHGIDFEVPAGELTMPLQDRAVNVLEILLSEPGLRTGPIAFVSHSLGGLIVKQILLDLQQQKDRRPEAKDLLERVTQVVFAATPHTGSRQGTLLDRLRFLAWPSSIARTLVANDPALRSTNVAYRGLADERRNVLQHRIFYETQGTPAGVIVDEASSDPGLPGDPPVTPTMSPSSSRSIALRSFMHEREIS